MSNDNPNKDVPPTAAVLLKFANKEELRDVAETKHRQTRARHQISDAARVLTDAVRKRDSNDRQLKAARAARKKGGSVENG